MGARGGGVTPTPSSSAALVLPLLLLPLLLLVSLLDRLLVASLISTSTAVSPCVCPCERASEGVSAAPPRRAAPAAPLSMCSGAHPVLNNSGHVNRASPAALAAGARPAAEAAPSPGRGVPGPCLRSHQAALPNSCFTLGTHGVPRWPHFQATQGRDLHPESSAHSATLGGPYPGSVNAISPSPDS